MSALREMLIKIGIISDIEGAKQAEQALDDTAAAAQKVDDTVGDAAGGAEKLAGAVEKISVAGAKAAEPMTKTAEAAGELGREAGPAAEPTGQLASQLGVAAGSAAILATAFTAAQSSVRLAVDLIREHIQALKDEVAAIEAQQTLNHAGMIDRTTEALGRLCDEYDRLDAKRRRDYEAVTEQIAIDQEYELAVAERDMRKAIAADPDNETAIRKNYKQRETNIRLGSERAKLNADLDQKVAEEKDAEAKAADAAENEARANAAYDEAQRHQAEIAAERDAKMAAAGARTPLLSWRRAGLGTGFTDVVYDAPRNREKRQERIAEKYAPRIEEEGKNTEAANIAAQAAKRVREQAEIDVELARRRREMLLQRTITLSVKEETAALNTGSAPARASQTPPSGSGSTSAQGGSAAGPTNGRLANEMNRAAENIDATAGALSEAVRNILSATERLSRDAADAAARTKQPGG